MKLPPRPRLRPRLKFEQLEDRITPTSSTVTTLLDVVNPNDGVISLREAIAAAEADGAADTIDFAPALAKGTISLSQFDTGLDPDEAGPSAFNITTAITILGSGQVIQRDSQASNFRLFFVSSAGGLTLDNLELRSGFARGGNGFSGGGGAAGLGGAIFNQGTLTVRNSLLDGNTAQGGNGSTVNFQFGAGGGGGLGQSASNASGGGPNGGSGGNGGFGGGGSGNSEGLAGNGGFGGGGGSATFNTVGGLGGFGGGDGGSDAGFLSRGLGANPANGANGGAGAGMGGAIFNLFGTTNVINSTITGNRTIGGTDGGGSPRGRGLGGGVFNLNGTLKVVNSTFDANRADFGGSIYNFSQDATDGIPSQQAAVATLANSIFEDSTNPDLLGADSLPAASGDEVHNAFLVKSNVTSGSFLATIDASAPNITNNGGFVNENGDLNSSGLIIATRPVVNGTLADNGGLTRSLALTADSEALNVGDNTKAKDPATSAALATDQRGGTFPRIADGTVDLGAFEAPATSPPPPPPPPPAGKPGTIVFVSPTFVVVQNGQAGQPNPADPFPLFEGENRVAVGDVNHDGIPDFIFSAGDGGGPHIRVISGKDGSVLHNFFAYDSSFRGGAFVASNDLNGDGFADIITGPGPGGGPHVRAFSGKDGTIIADFFAYDPSFRGGVTVAVGDVNGDGVHDIITGPGPGGGSQIEVIDGTKLGLKNPITAQILPAAVYASFFAFDPSFIGGVFVGAGNLDGDKFADIVAGPLTRGSPRAVVFTGKALQQANSIFTSDPGLRTGLRFTLADTNGDGIDELVVVAGPGGGPQEVVINPLTGEVIQSVFFSDPASRSGFGVG